MVVPKKQDFCNVHCVTPSLHAHNSKIPRTYVHASYIFATLKEGGIPICPGEERKCAYFATSYTPVY